MRVISDLTIVSAGYNLYQEAYDFCSLKPRIEDQRMLYLYACPVEKLDSCKEKLQYENLSPYALCHIYAGYIYEENQKDRSKDGCLQVTK